MSIEQIRQGLLARGWPTYRVNEAINYVGVQSPVTQSSPALSLGKNKPRKLIIYAVVIVFIIGGVFAFLSIRGRCEENQYFEEGVCVDYTCVKDSDCNDNNLDTIDTCINPGMLDATCKHELIVCAECQYLKRGTCKDSVCCTDLDCNDSNSSTTDICIDPGTDKSYCQNNPPIGCESCQYLEGDVCKNYTCCVDSDCNDLNSSTTDICLNPGLLNSTCKNELLVCGECGYFDGIMCKNYTCCADLDCNDINSSTNDTCVNAGLLNASCKNELIVCPECYYLRNGRCRNSTCCTDLHCNDFNTNTNDTCVNPGTEDAECQNTILVEGACQTVLDCNDSNACTIDTCSGTPKVCSNEAIIECVLGDGCCPSECTYYRLGTYPLVLDDDCEIPQQENEPLTFNATYSASSSNPHTVVLFQNFDYDEADDENHGITVTRAELSEGDVFTQDSVGEDDEILLVNVMEVGGGGISEQIITADIDGGSVDIYLPSEDPVAVTGHSYYVALDGSTYYQAFGGSGNFVPPDEAFMALNLARGAG